jgi:hypothetical protein
MPRFAVKEARTTGFLVNSLDWMAAVRLHWKTVAIVEYAAGRPFAWVDDELGCCDREYVAEHHDGPALLHWVSPRLGLTDENFGALKDWARALEHGRSP